jgi:FkbM family methyltransferase
MVSAISAVKFSSKISTFVRYTVAGLRLGADRRSRWLLATMLPRFKLVRAVGPRDEGVWRINLRLGDRRLPLHFRTQDIFIVQEVLVGNPYCPDWLQADSLRCIMDLGSHIGLSTLQFKVHSPEARIHCYEPDPDNFRLLEANTRELDGVVLHQEAVGAVSGDSVFHTQPERRSAGSLVEPRERTGTIEVGCMVRSLDDILSDIGGADQIKFDIEGMEYEVFAASRLVHEVRFVVGEMKATIEELKRFLALFPHHQAQVNSLTAKMHLVYLWRR